MFEALRINLIKGKLLSRLNMKDFNAKYQSSTVRVEFQLSERIKRLFDPSRAIKSLQAPNNKKRKGLDVGEIESTDDLERTMLAPQQKQLKRAETVGNAAIHSVTVTEQDKSPVIAKEKRPTKPSKRARARNRKQAENSAAKGRSDEMDVDEVVPKNPISNPVLPKQGCDKIQEQPKPSLLRRQSSSGLNNQSNHPQQTSPEDIVRQKMFYAHPRSVSVGLPPNRTFTN
jgi:hypothetical protein